jgi:DNA-binding HxlR family transcriptional regulator
MAGYGQYCPIAKAVEVVGERWSLLIVREMLVGASRFNEIARGLPGISRTLLSTRLRQLQRAGVIERNDSEYTLTPSGRDLAPWVFGLGHWAQTWILTDPEPDELDPTLLVWWAHDRLRTELLPDRRVVLEIRFVDHDNRYWLVIEANGTSVCEFDPGFGVDASITTDLFTLHRVWNGREDFRTALRAERIRLQGPGAIVRRLPDVLSIATLGEMAEGALPQFADGRR